MIKTYIKATTVPNKRNDLIDDYKTDNAHTWSSEKINGDLTPQLIYSTSDEKFRIYKTSQELIVMFNEWALSSSIPAWNWLEIYKPTEKNFFTGDWQCQYVGTSGGTYTLLQCLFSDDGIYIRNSSGSNIGIVPIKGMCRFFYKN